MATVACFLESPELVQRDEKDGDDLGSFLAAKAVMERVTVVGDKPH